ncbi:putative enhancer of polycomb protein [Helianthus anomalus]
MLIQLVMHIFFDNIFFFFSSCQRERWQKPVLGRLLPPPPVNDTNPYNVFRPREKAHRLHTRRMQRRENNVQSFEKLRQGRHNLEQVKSLLEALIKREEKKREVIDSEVALQRIQLKYKMYTGWPLNDRVRLWSLALHQSLSQIILVFGIVMFLIMYIWNYGSKLKYEIEYMTSYLKY